MEVRQLAVYVPSEYKAEVIETEIRRLLPSCCQCEAISVRVPNGLDPHPDNLQWHQDGGGGEGTTQHMVVWASEQPTDLRMSDGRLATGAPFDLMWFDNTKVFHKQPEGTRPSARWFVSVRCSGKVF